MARPKKPRLMDGVVLEDYLYGDPRKRQGYFRYLLPNGKFATFQADDIQKANEVAALHNQHREADFSSPALCKDSLVFLVPLYITYREEQDPALTKKDSWKNRRGHLRNFASDFQSTPIQQLTRRMISDWWLGLTYHQQKLRHAELRKLFNWLMGEGLCRQLEYNPFTTADDRPRLYLSGQEPKARQRLDRSGFWAVYNAAGELDYDGLQIAMGISLITFMRESDVLALRLDADLDDRLLKMVIGKSLNQKGSARAARLKWDLQNHKLLKDLLNRARELSLKNYRCPLAISHTPKVKKRGKTKEHVCQVTPRRLQEMFEEARALAGLGSAPEGETPPTFHEIRSLADKLATDAGYDIKAIRDAMAHEDESTTMDYLEGHQLPYNHVDIVFTEEIIGGKF